MRGGTTAPRLTLSGCWPLAASSPSSPEPPAPEPVEPPPAPSRTWTDYPRAAALARSCVQQGRRSTLCRPRQLRRQRGAESDLCEDPERRLVRVSVHLLIQKPRDVAPVHGAISPRRRRPGADRVVLLDGDDLKGGQMGASTGFGSVRGFGWDEARHACTRERRFPGRSPTLQSLQTT